MIKRSRLRLFFVLSALSAAILPTVSPAQTTGPFQTTWTLSAASTTAGVSPASITTTGNTGSCAVTIDGTFSGTLVFEGSSGGSTQPIAATNSTSSSSSSTASTPGLYFVQISSLRSFDVRLSALSSGAPIVTFNCSPATYVPPSTGGSGGGGTYTAPPNQPVSPATGTSPFPIVAPSAIGVFAATPFAVTGVPTPIPTLAANVDGGSPVHVANTAVPVVPGPGATFGVVVQNQVTPIATLAPNADGGAPNHVTNTSVPVAPAPGATFAVAIANATLPPGPVSSLPPVHNDGTFASPFPIDSLSRPVISSNLFRPTANIVESAGATAGTLVTFSATAATHLCSVTVALMTPGVATAATSLTDGVGGAQLALIPANYPGGDLPIQICKPFTTSIYANTTSTSPAFTISYGA